MTLRTRLSLYLAAVHLLMAVLGVAFLIGARRWLIVAEVVMVVSLGAGIVLLRGVRAPRRLTEEASRLLQQGDFTSRLVETGQSDLDPLVRVYNQMADRLREERVHQQEQHYFLGKLVAASPLGIVILDLDGRIADANPAAVRLLERPVDALVGLAVGAVPGSLARALASLQPGEPTVASLPDGRKVRCQRGSFVDRGFPRGFLLVEELTEELRRAERAAYEKLIRMMSHEVNNTVGATGSLLHSCLVYADQLREPDRREFETALGVVLARNEQLSRFMNAFADVVRLPPPQREPCEVLDLVDNAERLLSADSRRRQIRWRRIVDEPIAPVSLDRVQMEQVLLNVCKNALEAIGESGTVTVRVARPNGRRMLAIEDTGPGVADEARSQLFTPFFTTKDHGQGIGLMLVREILNRHGFEHALEATAGGPGVFRIWFDA